MSQASRTNTQEAVMAKALIEAIAAGRTFWWVKHRKPHGLTVMRDWQPRLFH